MASENAYKTKTIINEETDVDQSEATPAKAVTMKRFLFGVDSRIPANDLLQNNIDLFEWVKRNKIYPCFWGRNINGEDRLTKEESIFLRENACKVAPIYVHSGEKKTEDQGKGAAIEAMAIAKELDIPNGTAIFLEISDGEKPTRDYLKGYAKAMLGVYIPAFKANTDAKFAFDREFSRGMQTDKDIFEHCLIWATAPTVPEYEGITTTHLVHPQAWKPFAPSGVTRNEIAVWQYGTKCHRIQNDNGKDTEFNLDLVKNDKTVIENMF